MPVTRFFEALCRMIEIFAGLLLGSITVLIFVSVVGRYLFTYPVPDHYDLSRLLMGATLLWGYAALGVRGNHISLDILTRRLPDPAQRAVNILVAAVLAGFTALLAYKMFSRVSSAYRSGETTFDLQLPIWPFTALIWAGAMAAVLTTGFHFLQAASRGGRMPEQTPPEGIE